MVLVDNLPAAWHSLVFQFGWNWINLGNNQYKIRIHEAEGQKHTVYKEGENLVEEKPVGITKIVHEPYE